MPLSMLYSNAYTTTTREHVAAISNKGQITIPASILRRLNLNQHRKVAIVVEPSGAVQLKAPNIKCLNPFSAQFVHWLGR